MPAPSPLRAPKPDQTTLSFAGAFQAVRPGPKSLIKPQLLSRQDPLPSEVLMRRAFDTLLVNLTLNLVRILPTKCHAVTVHGLESRSSTLSAMPQPFTSETDKKPAQLISVYEAVKHLRKKYDISDRCSTKQAQKAPVDLREKLQSWFQYNCRFTIRRKGSLLGSVAGHPHCTNLFDTKYVGRFKLSQIAKMDQTPLAFEFLDRRTYEVKGEKTMWLKETGFG